MTDLNSDMGELRELERDGTQERLLSFVTSANVACGAHAGDEVLMETTIRAALRHGVAIGAHPGFPDREGFGRVVVSCDIAAEVERQCRALDAVAARCGARIVHVKPHGAMYSVAAAEAVAEGVARWRPDVALVGLAGTAMIDVFRRAGFRTLAEGFADRRYGADGTLRNRRYADALITDPAEAAEQAVRLSKTVDTICIHSDTPGSVRVAEAVRRALETT